jgi:hypothetical protein
VSLLDRPDRLGDRLLQAGLITRTQLDTALLQQQARIDGGQRLGRTLVELGFLTERDLLQMLAVFRGMAVAPFAIADAEPRAIAAMPAYLARRHRAVPCRIVNGSLLVAAADALSREALADLEAVTGHPVLLYLGPEGEIDQALAHHYREPPIPPARLRDLGRRLLQLADDQERQGDAATRAEIERIRAELDTM